MLHLMSHQRCRKLNHYLIQTLLLMASRCDGQDMKSIMSSSKVIGKMLLGLVTIIRMRCFQGQFYSLRYTCALDSALFSLYFVYKTDIHVASEFDNAPSTSSYSTLAKAFQMVETDGWDTARLFWSMHFNILKQTD